MERYDEYKDSGVEWIGEIPAGWEVARIGQVASLSRQFDSHDNRYVGLENIESWTGRYVESDSSYDTSQAVAFDSGDVLFGKLRPYLAKVFEASFSGLCSSELLPLTPRRVDGAYLSFCLRSPRFIDVVNESTYGTKMPRANWQYIRRLQIPLPPRNVQAAIASFLRSRTYEIDGVIADCEREIELLQEYRKAVISEAVTKGLDPNVPMKDSGIEWIGDIPKFWRLSKVKFAFINRDAARVPIEASKRDQNSEKLYPYYGASGVVDYIADFIFDEPLLLIGEDGANLRLRNLPLVYAASGKYWVNNHAHILEPSADIEYWYAYYQLELVDLAGYLTGSTQPKLTTEHLSSVPIVLPSLSEQRAIVAYLDKKTAEIDAFITDYQSMTDRLREYRKSLVYEAVTGKFRVSRGD